MEAVVAATGTRQQRGAAPANPHGLLLYDYGGSPCARRVRISLLEKGLAWDTQTIDLSRLEQRAPEYLAINPNGLVPTLAHGERVIWESNVITQYLDDAFPQPSLYPQDPWELAQVRMWQAAEQAMAKDYRPLMYQRLIGPILRLKYSLDEALAVARQSTLNPADLDWERKVWSLAVLTPAEQAQAEQRLYGWLDKVEQALQSRDFLVGAGFSQAEISIYPRVAMYPYIGLRIARERYPRTCEWMRRLESRPSFPQTQTPQDRAVLRLAKSGILPWIARQVARPASARRWYERLGLALLKRLVTRATAKPRPLAGPPPALKKPANGLVPPGGCAPRPPLSAARITERITLHEFESAPECARLRWLMTELGLPFERRSVDLGRLAHKAPPILQLNPFGELPVIEHGGRVLYDSSVIAEYLAALAGDSSWFPRDALQLAHVRMWLAFDAGMHKEFRPLYWLHAVRPTLLRRGVSAEAPGRWIAPGVDDSQVAWLQSVIRGTPRFDSSPEHARAILAGKLRTVERELAQRRWIAGDSASFADLALYTRFALFPALGVALDAAALPRLTEWMQRLQQRPAFEALRLTGT